MCRPVLYNSLDNTDCVTAFGQIEQKNTLYTLTYSWNFIWEKHLGRENKKLILEFRQQNKALAIVPLIITQRRFKNILPWKVLRFFGQPFSDWNDVLISKHSDKVFEGLLYELNQSRANEIVLQNLAETPPFLEFLKKRHTKNLHIKKQTPCYYIETTGDFETYIKQSTSKQFVQQDIRRLFRKLDAENKTVTLCEIPANEIIKEYPTFSELHKSSQFLQQRKSYFFDPSTKKYFLDLIRQYSPKGQLRLYYLKFSDIKVAFVLALYFQQTFYYWNIGYDPDYKAYSPSKLLLYKLVKQCFTDETKEINLMRGDSYYKTKWTKTFRINYQVRILPTKGLTGIINKIRRVG